MKKQGGEGVGGAGWERVSADAALAGDSCVRRKSGKVAAGVA